jgi:hypothetical protein
VCVDTTIHYPNLCFFQIHGLVAQQRTSVSTSYA